MAQFRRTTGEMLDCRRCRIPLYLLLIVVAGCSAHDEHDDAGRLSHDQPPVGTVTEALPKRLPESELLGEIERFCEEALLESAIRIEDLPKEPGRRGGVVLRGDGRRSTQPRPDGLESYWLTLDGSVAEAHLHIDPATGVIRYYDASHVTADDENKGARDDQQEATSNARESATASTELSKEEAFEIARRVLHHFGEPQEIESYRFSFGRSEKSCGMTFSRLLAHKGVPYLERSISVGVSCHSGRVFSVYYDPITALPTAPKTRISKTEALRIATKKMKKHPYFRWRPFDRVSVDYDVDLENIDEYIFQRRNKGLGVEYPPVTAPNADSSQPRYCWHVPFKFTEDHPDLEEIVGDNSMWAVYVDIETGEVLN